MIEQLCYTWSPVGLRRISGWQVRAASPGLSDMYSDRYLAIERHLGYALPEGLSPVATQPKDAPVALDLLDLADDLVLMQKRFVGAVQRGPGIYFVHALAGLPRDFTAEEAISLWDSPFWRSSADDLPQAQVALPQISADDLRRQVRALSLAGNELVRECLPFVIQAFLALTPSQHLYIAAPSSVVAMLVYGLVTSLPRSFTNALNFSTYGKDVRQSPATIVGTTWRRESDGLAGPAPSKDLPAECYLERGLAINCYSGRRSGFPEPSLTADLAKFAASCLYDGEIDELRDFTRSAENQGVRDTRSLLLIYRARKGSLADGSRSPEDLSGLLNTPNLASPYLSDAANRRTIMETALAHKRWWVQVGQRLLLQCGAVLTLSDDSSAAQSLICLGHEAAEGAADAITRSDVRGAETLLSLARCSSPAEYPQLCSQFLKDVLQASEQPPNLYSWDARAWLLSLAASVYSPSVLLDTGPEWLHVPWSDLGRLLSLPIHPEWRQFSALVAIAEHLDSPLTRDDWKAVAERQDDIEQAAIRLLNHCKLESRSYPYLARFLDGRSRGKLDVFAFLLLSANAAPAGGLSDFLATAANTAELSPSEIISLVESNPDLVLGCLLDDETRNQLTRGYLWSIGEVDSLPDNSIALLRQVASGGDRLRAPYQCVSMSQGWVRIYDYLANPSLRKDHLEVVANAIEVVRLRRNGSIAETIVALLASKIRTAEELESVLVQLGASLSDGYWQLFLRLFRQLDGLQERPSASTYAAYWEMAIGTNLPPAVRSEFRRWVDGLLGNADQHSH